VKRKLRPLKKIILTAIITGCIYAVLMAGYDYSVGESFSLCKFLLHLTIFGVIMAFLNRFGYSDK